MSIIDHDYDKLIGNIYEMGIGGRKLPTGFIEGMELRPFKLIKTKHKRKKLILFFELLEDSREKKKGFIHTIYIWRKRNDP